MNVLEKARECINKTDMEIKNETVKNVIAMITNKYLAIPFEEKFSSIEILDIDYGLIIRFLSNMRERYDAKEFAIEVEGNFKKLIDQTNSVEEDILYKSLLLMNKIDIFKPFTKENNKVSLLVYLFLIKEYKLSKRITDRELYLVFEIFLAADQLDLGKIAAIENKLFI
jgi:hypothetical protein